MKTALSALVVLMLAAFPAGAQEKFAITQHKTPDGIKFALMGEKGAKPAPTLFVFAGSKEDSLRSDDFNKIGKILSKVGFLSVSIDIPSHGEESGSLGGWRAHLEKGNDFVTPFAAKVSAVLDHLIKEGYTDPDKVAAAGTSRGGFIALHVAAREKRLGAVVAFAPVIDLLAVTEFKGLENNASAKGLSLLNHAGKVANRRIWLCIGNQDIRVNTDDAIAFTRAAVKAANAPKGVVPIELHVMPTPNHAIHSTAHEEAAGFVLAGTIK